MDYQTVIEEIKSRIDIVDFISDFIDLKKKGNSYKALCPFHAEKTPSFVVNPDKQIFHCFGCGAGGDIIGFVMKEEGSGFVEAVRFLAERCGINIAGSAPRDKGALQRRERLFEIQKRGMSFFVDTLRKTSHAMEYLLKRGLSREIIERFSIGFSLERWDGLMKYLAGKGFTNSEISQSGLVVVKDNKNAYDVFRGRIIFPIIEMNGKTVGFGGRVMDTGMPKYLNSPETDIFKKGRLLFGLNMAKESIQKRGYIMVVEGYFDVVVCHQYGFENTVAPLGTSLTEQHVRLIKRYTNNMLILFDGDQAGISAARRAMDMSCRQGMSAKALLLPKDSDPDSFLNAYGAEKFERLFSGALDYIDFMLKTGGEGIDNIREIYRVLQGVGDSVAKSKMVSELADRTSMSETILREDMSRGKKGGEIRSSVPNIRKIKGPEEILLGIYISRPEMVKIINDLFSETEPEHPFVKKLFRTFKTQNIKPSFDSLPSFCSEEEISSISRLLIDSEADDETIEKTVNDCIRKVRKERLEKKIKLAESQQNIEELQKLLMEKREFIAKDNILLN